MAETKRMAEEANRMAQEAQDRAQRMGHEFQNAGQSFEAAGRSLGEVNRGFQAIAAEMTEYSKKTFDDAIRTWEQLIGVRSLEQAIQIQSDYAKRVYENHMAELSKLGEMCVGMVRDVSKPVEDFLESSDRERPMSKPLKLQIVEQARPLIADESHWCRRHLAQDVNGVAVPPTSASAVKRCGLGAVIAAAYQITHDFDAAHQLGHEALRPRYGAATLIHVNDVRGHAAVLALFDELIAAA